MFFSLSKLFWLLSQPVTLVFLLILVGFFALWRGARKLALTALGLSSFILFVGCFTTLGAVLLTPLEERFSQPEQLPGHVDGIIVLGGYMDGEINAGRRGFELNSAADRLVETLRLARLYPDARIIVSGGKGTFFEESQPEADSTRSLLEALGFSGERFLYENQSRNTVENASYSKALAKPQEGETWLLVTSAYHMPRAIGCFRKAGFDVLAWPVDYKTRLNEGLTIYFEQPLPALSRLSMAMREWIGLFAYWLTGKTDMLLPQP